MQLDVHHDVVIHQILGRVSSKDSWVLCGGTPHGNSTRWVFDVQTEPSVTLFSIELLSWSRRPVTTHVVSCSMTPFSSSFWLARPWVEELDTPRITFASYPADKEVRYRIAVDLVHSQTR